MDGPALTKRDSSFILCDGQGGLRSFYPVESGAASGRLSAIGVALRANHLLAKSDEEPPPSSEFGRPAAMNCGGPPALMVPTSPSGSLTGSPQPPGSDRAGRFDKKFIGDVFYASAAARGEAIVESRLGQERSFHD